jgi:hypothetical protein
LILSQVHTITSAKSAHVSSTSPHTGQLSLICDTPFTLVVYVCRKLNKTGNVRT